MAFDERLAARPQHRHQFRHVVADELTAAVDQLAEPVAHGLDASADPVACFHDDEINACLAEHLRSRQAGESGADDNHIRADHAAGH